MYASAVAHLVNHSHIWGRLFGRQPATRLRRDTKRKGARVTAAGKPHPETSPDRDVGPSPTPRSGTAGAHLFPVGQAAKLHRGPRAPRGVSRRRRGLGFGRSLRSDGSGLGPLVMDNSHGSMEAEFALLRPWRPQGSVDKYSIVRRFLDASSPLPPPLRRWSSKREWNGDPRSSLVASKCEAISAGAAIAAWRRSATASIDSSPPRLQTTSCHHPGERQTTLGPI